MGGERFHNVVACVCTAIILASACDTPAKENRQTVYEDLEPIEMEILDGLAENQDNTCLRPVLSATSRAESSRDLIKSIFEGDGENSRCFDAILGSGKTNVLAGALFRPRLVQECASGAKPMYEVLQLDDPNSNDALLDMVVHECGSLLMALEEALRCDDACSPYQPGINGIPDDFMYRDNAIVFAVSASARMLLKDGRHHAAVEQILQGLQFEQDMRRDGVEWILAMSTVYGSMKLLTLLDRLILDGEELSTDTLGKIIDDLSLLIAHEPDTSRFLRAEYQQWILYWVLPWFREPGWIPPGGWGKELIHAPEVDPEPYTDAWIPEDAVIYLALASSRRYRGYLRACTPMISPPECYLGYSSPSPPTIQDALRRGLTEYTEIVLQHDLSKIDEYMEKRRVFFRDVVVDTMMSETDYEHKDIASHGGLLFYLAALRLKAAILLENRQSGRCMTEKELHEDPVAGFMQDPFTHEEFDTWRDVDGAITVSSGSRYETVPGCLSVRVPCHQ